MAAATVDSMTIAAIAIGRMWVPPL